MLQHIICYIAAYATVVSSKRNVFHCKKIPFLDFMIYTLACDTRIIREIGGIQKRTPGYKEINIKPSLDCGLKWSECSFVIPYGKVLVKWELLDGQAQITVEIPFNTKAFIKLPKEEITVASGKYQFN